MKMLILGGTVFLGRHIAAAALARGHALTLFTRGQHGAELFPAAEHLRGNRDGDLAALKGRRWDAVIDTSGYIPRAVRDLATLLADCGHYTFISSVSAYADASEPITEATALATPPDASVETVTGTTYGSLKVGCEQAAQAVFGERALIIRPGLIVGPHDPTDRFTYWPHRIAAGGAVVAPSPASAPVQIIDVRDLAAWIVALAERGTGGALNAVGPAAPLTMGELLETCRAVTGSDATLRWHSEAALLAGGVAPWSDLPLWLASESDPTHRGMQQTSTAQAIAAGLTYRPLAETVADTLSWSQSRPADHQWRAGLTREREQALLASGE